MYMALSAEDMAAGCVLKRRYPSDKLHDLISQKPTKSSNKESNVVFQSRKTVPMKI